MSMCLVCYGSGTIITCCDDICVGGDHCIHGDGEEMCHACDGEGYIGDDDMEYDYDDFLEDRLSGVSDDELQAIFYEAAGANPPNNVTAQTAWREMKLRGLAANPIYESQ